MIGKHMLIACVVGSLVIAPAFALAERGNPAPEPTLYMNGMPPEGAAGKPVRMATGTVRMSPEAKEMMEKRERMMGTTTSGNPIPGRMEERKDAAQERLEGMKQERVKEFARVTIARMRAAIERLAKIADRIDTRIAKLEANGKDVSAMKDAMVIARGEIEKAKTQVANAEAQFTTYIPPTSAQSATGTPTRLQPGLGQPNPMRDALKKAEVAIRTAHKALSNAVGAMGGREGNATSTEARKEKPPRPATTSSESN